MDKISGSFIWNIHKEKLNISKHGINFTVAGGAFKDPNRKIFVDAKHGAKEKRFFCIGKARGEIITVRFTYRENKIRIIGAGLWRKGRRYYEEKTS
jgi:uncharacterized DUF497 family protein